MKNKMPLDGPGITIVAQSSVICLKVMFSDSLGGGKTR